MIVEASKRRILALAGDLLDLVYPPTCLACGVEMECARELVCPLCRASIVTVGRRGCRKCGAEPLPGSAPRPTRCRRCTSRPFAFRRAVAAVRYAGAIRDVVRAVKFQGRREGIPFLGERLVRAVEETGIGRRASVVVPLPLHPARRFVRGFDQADRLAVLVARAIERPLVRGAIRRRRFQAPQATAAPHARRTRVAGAFAPTRRGGRVRDRSVLLIDDVLSTGATADAATRALLGAGARSVDVAVVAT